MQAGQTSASATNEIGTPLTHYRPGMPDEPVQVENISASGLAFAFPIREKTASPLLSWQRRAASFVSWFMCMKKLINPLLSGVRVKS